MFVASMAGLYQASYSSVRFNEAFKPRLKDDILL